jgi:hypothetical protein
MTLNQLRELCGFTPLQLDYISLAIEQGIEKLMSANERHRDALNMRLAEVRAEKDELARAVAALAGRIERLERK